MKRVHGRVRERRCLRLLSALGQAIRNGRRDRADHALRRLGELGLALRWACEVRP